MRVFRYGSAMALLVGLLTVAHAQDTPTDISKKELPKKAHCVVCTVRGSGEGEEKPAAGVRYKGTAYYFCNAKEATEFKKEPETWIPLPLPRPAPDFMLKTLTDTEVTKETYKDKVLLVDFWATWCKPCIATMPELQKLYADYAEKGLVVLGISIDEKGAKVVKPFVTKHKFLYPMALDAGEKPMWQAYRVKGVPALFLIDKEGNIVRQWLGKPDKIEVEKAVLELLK